MSLMKNEHPEIFSEVGTGNKKSVRVVDNCTSDVIPDITITRSGITRSNQSFSGKVFVAEVVTNNGRRSEKASTEIPYTSCGSVSKGKGYCLDGVSRPTNVKNVGCPYDFGSKTTYKWSCGDSACLETVDTCDVKHTLPDQCNKIEPFKCAWHDESVHYLSYKYMIDLDNDICGWSCPIEEGVSEVSSGKSVMCMTPYLHGTCDDPGFPFKYLLGGSGFHFLRTGG